MGARSANRIAQFFLVIFMGIGSISLWLVVPVFWVWLASQMQKSSQPSLGPYLLVLVGIGISVFILAKLLAAADRAYGRFSGTGVDARRRMPWHKSMRGERDEHTHTPPTVLTRTMVISVSLALTVFGIWFFLFAGNSGPTG
jgi:Na+-transporting methylmalonyl-CoA/oxaloacetate decarboxylase gamma subunit